MLGQYIDSLSEEQKDRVVRQTRWRPMAPVWKDGARCLTAAAQGAVKDPEWGWVPTFGGVSYAGAVRREDGACYESDPEVEIRFDRLCRRFGLDRIVRLCKLRAGADVEDLEPLSCAPTSSAGAHG